MEYICIRKCFFNDRLYEKGERVHFNEGIQVPRHFAPVEQKGKPNVQQPEVKLSQRVKLDKFELYHNVYSCLSKVNPPPTKEELELVYKEIPIIENTLEQKIVNQIKSLRLTKENEDLKYHQKCVLIVGNKIELIEGIVSYIFYVLQKEKIEQYVYKEQLWKGITCEDYSYLNETDTREKLFKEGHIIDNEWRHRSNGMLFLKNLNYEYTSLIMRMLDIIRKGMAITLVVSTDKADNLPQKFRDQFEIIDLEPEKQSKTDDTAQQGITTIFYDDSQGILFLANGKHCKLTGNEQTLVDYLRKDNQHFSDIIEHFQANKEYHNTNWDRNNFDNLKTDLNTKSLDELGVELIKNLEKRSGKYGISVKIKDKKFKK